MAGKDRDAPAGTRSGPRARAAQDRKFSGARSRDSSREDPYQRAARPGPRAGAPRPGRDTPFGERLRAPMRGGGGIVLDADVARVFRDSEAVNEALRLVIRLGRLASGGARPAGFDRARPYASSGPRSVAGRSGPDERARERPKESRGRAPATPEPKFEESE